jgi:hypothetical protein
MISVLSTKIFSRSMCDYRRGLDWWIYLLITYTYYSELQTITAPPLISTIHKSPQHPLSRFQPAVSSPAVPWLRFLTVEILHLHVLKSSLHSFPWRIDWPELSQSRSQGTLWLEVYHQSVSLRVKPLETHNQRFFQLNSYGNSLYVTSSLTRIWVYLLWICLAFHEVYTSHI